MIMFSLACRCSSLIHDFALSRDDCDSVSMLPNLLVRCKAYSLCDIVDNDGAVGVSVIHGCQRLVSLLTSGIPYLKFDCGVLVQRYSLSQESGADR